MTSTVSEVGACSAALRSLLSAVEDYVAECSVASLSSAELAGELAARERARRLLSAADHALILEVETRGVGVELGARSTAGLLQDLLRLSPAESGARLRAAWSLGGHTSLTGEAIAPLLPASAAADAAGDLSSGHVAAILRVMDDLPSNLSRDQVGEADRILADVASQFAPKQVLQVGQRMVDTIDPDGAEPVDVPEARRGLQLQRRRDGWASLSGRLTPECVAEAEAVFNALAAPRPGTNPDGSAGDAEPDLRTPTQRRHDALLDLFGLALRADTLPITGRRAQLIVTTDAEVVSADADAGTDADADCAGFRSEAAAGCTAPDVAEPDVAEPDVAEPDVAEPDVAESGAAESAAAGVDATVPNAPVPVPPTPRRVPETRWSPGRSAFSSFGLRLSRQVAFSLCDTAMLATVTLDRQGGILDYGQTRRFATKAQLRALIARDGGCSFPGCDHPPEWCDAHHIIAWIDDGPTALWNLTLLCGFHHRNFHRMGWTCRIANGVPLWTPPARLDANQTPRRHHRYLLRRGARLPAWNPADHDAQPSGGHDPPDG